MFLLKLQIEIDATILSGNEVHILITRLLKKCLSRSETTDNLANLNRLPRVEGLLLFYFVIVQ